MSKRGTVQGQALRCQRFRLLKSPLRKAIVACSPRVADESRVVACLRHLQLTLAMLMSFKLFGMAHAIAELAAQGVRSFDAAQPMLGQLLKAETAEWASVFGLLLDRLTHHCHTWKWATTATA